MTQQRFTIMKQCMLAFGIVLNILGAFLAMNLRLPIYMDSVGTIFVSSLLGPFYGMAAGFFGSLVSGITFDIYSLYYAPAQLLTGLMAGLMFRTEWLKGKRRLLGNLAISLPTTFASVIVTVRLFGGITSSSSTYLILLLDKMGVDLTISCLLIQGITDYGDELVAVCAVAALMRLLTPEMKAKISGGCNGSI